MLLFRSSSFSAAAAAVEAEAAAATCLWAKAKINQQHDEMPAPAGSSERDLPRTVASSVLRYKVLRAVLYLPPAPFPSLQVRRDGRRSRERPLVGFGAHHAAATPKAKTKVKRTKPEGANKRDDHLSRRRLNDLNLAAAGRTGRR